MLRNRTVEKAIEWFDNKRAEVLSRDPEADPWEDLLPDEHRWIAQEITHCRHDFLYAAGNYFWLDQTKYAREMLFDLWPAQEMLLDIVLHFWSKGLPARVMVHKARQLGMSTVSVALMTWKSIFYRQQVNMIIAQNPEHGAYMFGKIQYMMSRLPWWMQPHVAYLERKEAMVIGVPGEPDAGLNNFVVANSANKMSAFGQGKPIHGLSATELSTWSPAYRARQIVEGDLRSALVDRPGCFAIFESKPNGATGYWHDMWEHYTEEWLTKRRAAFYPLYIPAFFEPTRRRPAPHDFVADVEEIKVKERYALEWHQCAKCGKPVYVNCQSGVGCMCCGSIEHQEMWLDNDQLFWYRLRREEVNWKDEESVKLFKQEMSITAEEGFQAHGTQVFPNDVYAYVQTTARPGICRGYFDDSFKFHPNYKHCPQCQRDHSADEWPLEIWELPQPGARYVLGVDSAYGNPTGDYSVISVHKLGKGVPERGGWADEQVAEYRTHISAEQFGRVAYIIGKAYNEAKIAVEAHGIGDVTQYELIRMNYANLFQWKHYDSSKNIGSHKLGWWTNYQTKQMLISTFISWARRRIMVIRSLNFLREMPTFVREYDEETAGGATRGAHDDSILAAIICLFCSHDEDFDEDSGRIMVPGLAITSAEEAHSLNWVCHCDCGHAWDAANPRTERCQKRKPDGTVCGRMVDHAERKILYRKSAMVEQPAEVASLVGDPDLAGSGADYYSS